MGTNFEHLKQSKQIGDCLYTVEPLGFVDGRKGLVRLSNILGPSLASLSSARESAPRGDKTEESLMSLGLVALSAAFGGFLAKLTDADLEYFQGLFAPKTTVCLPDNKEPLLRDAIKAGHFDNRLADYFEWLAFAIQVTYGDFFKGAWTMLKNVLPQAPIDPRVSPSNSQVAFPGMTGD